MQALAQQLGLGSSQQPGRPEEQAESKDALVSPENLQGLLSALEEAAKPDQTTGVLEALRPLLQPERQSKIDKAIRAIRLMRAAKTASSTLEL
jgi:hypothetical protein